VFSPGRGRLGVQVDSLGDQLAQYFGAANGGALVTRVEPDSPAARAGLKAGDVITAVDGETVRDADDLAQRVGRATGDNLSVGYLRDKTSATATVTLEPRTPRAGPRDQRRPVRPARFMRPA
jgi:serine protease Do